MHRVFSGPSPSQAIVSATRPLGKPAADHLDQRKAQRRIEKVHFPLHGPDGRPGFDNAVTKGRTYWSQGWFFGVGLDFPQHPL